MEAILILWVLCAGLSYFIARDRVPEKAALATLLGFLLGPIGVAITFSLKPDTKSSEVSSIGRDSEFEQLSATEQQSKISDVLNKKSSKNTDDLKKELERMKANVSKI